MQTTFTLDQARRREGAGANPEPKPDEKPMEGSAEQRLQPRYPFTAAATAVDLNTGARIEARTTDLSAGGCYIDTMNPFPKETALHLRLTKDGKSFLADATVVYCGVGVGMGLRFAGVPPGERLTLEKWIHDAQGERVPEACALEQDERVLSEKGVDEEHYALEELLVVLMRKGLLTEEEGEPILRRLTRTSSQNTFRG